MSTHLTRRQQDGLRNKTLPLAELAEIGRHAATCEACRRSVLDSLPADRMVRDIRVQVEADDVDHLSPETLIAVAEGAIAGEELQEARLHLSDCELCAREVEELRRLQPRVTRPRPPALIIAVAASVAIIAAAILLVNRPAPAVRPSGPIAKPAAPRVSVPSAPDYARSTWNDWVAEAARSRELPVPPILAGLRSSKTKLRGPVENDLELQPDAAVVASARPRFRWSEPGIAATYKVILKSGRTLIESESLRVADWTPSAALTRGHEYEWQLEVTSGNDRRLYPRPPNPPARFRVLDQRAMDEIDDARRRYPNDALLHAVILAHYGLVDEAGSELDRLAQKNAPLAASLRESMRQWQR